MDVKSLDETGWNSVTFFFFEEGQADSLYLFLVTLSIFFGEKSETAFIYSTLFYRIFS